MTPAADLGARRALVVEDDTSIARFLGVLLGQMGWRTVVAGTGEQALDMFSVGTFLRVLCDIELGGGIDGIETVRRMRQLEPGLKVIFITGSWGDASRAGAIAPVMMKPFSPARLIGMIEQAE